MIKQKQFQKSPLASLQKRRPRAHRSRNGTAPSVLGGNPGRWKTFLAYLAVYIGWGTTYLAIRVGVQSLEPATFLGLRFLIASLLLLPFLILRRKLGATVSELVHSSAQGVLLLVGGLLPIAYAELTTPSNVTAIVIGCVPIAFAIFDRILNGTSIRGTTVIGFTFGAMGILALRSSGTGAANAQPIGALGLALVIFGCLSWAFASVYSRKLKPARDPLMHVFVQYVAAGFVLLLGAAAFEHVSLEKLTSAGPSLWQSLAYICLFPSLISYTAYMWLLQNEPSSRVSTYAFVNPVVAVIGGAMILGEPASPMILISLGLVMLGTWFTFRSKKC